MIYLILYHSQGFHGMFLTGVRLRSCTISAIFSKSLRLSNDSRQKTTTGNVVNLMTVDAQRFADIMLQIHFVWASPLQVLIAMWFLWGYVGASSLAGLAVLVLLIPLNGVLANKARVLQKQVMVQKDARIKEVSEVSK